VANLEGLRFANSVTSATAGFEPMPKSGAFPARRSGYVEEAGNCGGYGRCLMISNDGKRMLSGQPSILLYSKNHTLIYYKLLRNIARYSMKAGDGKDGMRSRF
jgi:hypothetical protein